MPELLAVVVGLVAGLISSVPMLGPVVLLLFGAGARGERASGTALAVAAALSEGVHVALAVWGVGPLLLAEPAVAIGLRVGSGVVLVALAWLAWRGADQTTPTRLLPARWSSALGLGVLLVLPNPGFLVVWVAIVSWLGTSAIITEPSVPFVIGAIVGVYLWFVIVLVIAARIGPRWNTRHGPRVRRVLAVALAGFGVWALVGALRA